MIRVPAASPAGSSRVWLEWAEWLALLAALGCWLASQQYSPIMVVGGGCLLVSWLARFGRTGQFIAPTALDLPLVAFLVAALVGLWVAPDGAAALVRLYWFTGAAALFVALAGSRAAVLRWVALGIVIAAGLLAVYFVTQNPWATAPVKLAVVNRLGQALGGLVPVWLGDRKGIAWPISAATLILIGAVLMAAGKVTALVFTLSAVVVSVMWVFATAYQTALIATLDRYGSYTVLIPAAQGAGAMLGPATASFFVRNDAYLPVTVVAVLFFATSLTLFLVAMRGTARSNPGSDDTPVTDGESVSGP